MIRERLEPANPDFKSDALTARPRCLLHVTQLTGLISPTEWKHFVTIWSAISGKYREKYSILGVPVSPNQLNWVYVLTDLRAISRKILVIKSVSSFGFHIHCLYLVTLTVTKALFPCYWIGIWKCSFLRGKPEYTEKNLSEQSREPTTNSTHI